MAKKMLVLLENKNLAKQMGAKGKERIEKYFTLEKYLEVLNRLIASSKKK